MHSNHEGRQPWSDGSNPSEGAAPRPPDSKRANVASKVMDDYEILEEIARGGMGVVYKARQKSLNRLVALKKILNTSGATENAVKRFRQEAISAAALEHPVIVPIYDFGEHDGTLYYTMPFIEGTNLWGLIAKDTLAPRAAVDLILPIVDAVAYAHDQKMIHRDLKPANILIDAHGRPRITDFGLAKHSQSDTGQSRPGEILGTLDYMAPEQARGLNKTLGPEADIYALGGILYFMLIGTPVFPGENDWGAKVYKVVHTPPVPPRQINPLVPEPLHDLIMRCLHKHPAQRYPSARELAKAVRALPWTENQAPTKRRLPYVWVALVLGVVLVMGAAFLGYQQFSPKSQGNQVPPTIDWNGDPANVVFAEKLQEDFELKVELTAGKFNKEDRVTYIDAEEKVSLKITAYKNCYVGVWSIDENGRAWLLFPVHNDPNHYFKEGQERIIPEKRAPFKATPSNKAEKIRVVASTESWAPQMGLPIRKRGLEPGGPLVAEKTVQYFVEKK